MLKVNSKIKTYLLSCINHEDRDDWPQETLTEPEKLRFIKETFKSEYWHEYHQQKYRNRAQAIASWLQGMSSACEIHFLPEDIIAQYKEWGSSGPYETYPKYATERWYKDMGFVLDRMMTNEGETHRQRAVEVCFDDTKHNFKTEINGTVRSVEKYYIGQPWNVAPYREPEIEDFQECTSLNFL